MVEKMIVSVPTYKAASSDAHRHMVAGSQGTAASWLTPLLLLFQIIGGGLNICGASARRRNQTRPRSGQIRAKTLTAIDRKWLRGIERVRG